jgi:hypothetical protein
MFIETPPLSVLFFTLGVLLRPFSKHIAPVVAAWLRRRWKVP